MKQLLRIIVTVLFRVNLINFNTLSFDGPAIILPNHVSFLDAIFLYIFLPKKVCFAINTDIAERFSFVVRWINHVTIDPFNPYHLKRLASLVREGQLIVLFPEGRITTTGGLMKIYSGVGFVALKTKAKIYPLIFSGLEFSKLSRIKDQMNVKWFPRVSIYVGDGICLETSEGKDYKEEKEEFNNRILEALQHAKFKAKFHSKQTNLFNTFLEAAKTHGMNKIVAEDINTSISYRKAIISTYILGSKLAGVLRREATVGVLLPNSVGHLLALFALSFLNKTPAILNFSAGLQNNMECAALAGVKSILTSRTFVEKGKLEELIEHLVPKYRIIYLEDIKETIGSKEKVQGYIQYLAKKKAAEEESSNIILFTSGSESKPKGVVLSHRNLLANVCQISSVIAYTHRDKMLNPLPMFHAFGLTAGALFPVLEGIQVFLYPNPLHYKAIPEIAYDRDITILLGTPTFLLGYAKSAHHYDFYNVRYAVAGGEKLKDEVRELWEEKFGIRILEGYGTTETAPVLSLNTPLFYRRGTVGKFLPGIEWRVEKVEGIGNAGNLMVKGPNVMAGYLLHGKGFVEADRWYNCGDVVHIDEQSFITIKSRLKRFAKISGEMVSLDAIEQMAEQYFGAGKNAVIHVPDGKKGEAIILYTTDSQATKKRFREYLGLRGQSILNMPSHIVIVEKLPLLGSGKIDYVTLNDWSRRMDTNEV